MRNDRNRNRQYVEDQNMLAEVLQRHQHSNGHAELHVQIHNGYVTVISDTEKHKPRKVAQD